MGGKRAAKLFVALHLVCVLVPLAVVAVWAFTSSWPWPELLPQTFSDRGIVELFVTSRDLGEVLAVSVGISLAVAALSTVVAAMAARALVSYRFFGKELFRFSTVLPFLIPATVFAMGVQVVFIHAGLANTVFGVVLAHTIVALPYAITIMSEVTAAAGEKLEQQARVSGAGPVRALFEVQIPLLLPGLLSAASLSYITSFSQYFLTLLVGGGTVKTFALVMFPYLASGDRTIASAYGVVFMAVTLGVFFLFELLLKRFASAKTEYFTD
ncbi:ABC transporter permease [Raoultibacter timonensis]|uniref:ABC transporter permease n=1 Tax=Raoultibacter timonensis TaxID=1907662 RepID=A0ABM7WHC3_9ACTN|nr:ABC transporter permease subunit [Raoultibacter timonensis]BDE95654.1 ABC transporter permease [Raoultibacter timonensis]BDF50258.1 ABC transporter permease [Raoultibacter timonensis]